MDAAAAERDLKLTEIDTAAAAAVSGVGAPGSAGFSQHPTPSSEGGFLSPHHTPAKRKGATSTRKKKARAFSDDEYSPLRPPLKPGVSPMFKPRKQARTLPPLVSRSLDFEAGGGGGGGGGGGSAGGTPVSSKKRKLGDGRRIMSQSTSALFAGVGGGSGFGGRAAAGGATTGSDGGSDGEDTDELEEARLPYIAESEESDATADDEISLLNSQMQFSFFPVPPPPGEDEVLDAVFGKVRLCLPPCLPHLCLHNTSTTQCANHLTSHTHTPF